MSTAINASHAASLKNSLRKSLYLAATVACFWPAAVNAQSWNPTASDASSNVAAGTSALANHTGGGTANTAIGTYALFVDTTGSYNTANGFGTLATNTTGSSNTVSGYDALNSNTTGGYNTASGRYALYYNTAGSNNVAMGFNALGSLVGGGSNIALGTNAGAVLTNGSRNIYVGHPGAAKETNIIRIGQTQTKTFIAGIAGVPASGATVVVRANGQLGVVASSARYKTDIRDLTDASDKLAQLRPVSYQYKTEPGVTHFGLIAEEVDKVMPELVVRDEQNRPETVQYQELIPLLLKERQIQQTELARQRALIEQQGRAASRDHAIIEQLIARVDKLSRARLAAR